MTDILTSTVLAAVIALGGVATGPADEPVPQSTESYRVPDEVRGSLVYNPQGHGTDWNGALEPVLEVVERSCSADVGVDNIAPNLALTLPGPLTVDDPGGTGQVVVEAGEYPGFVCDEMSSGSRFIMHPVYGAVEARAASTVWTDEQVEAMLDSTGRTGVVVESSGTFGADLTLREAPGPDAEPIVVLTPGTQLDAVGLPIDGAPLAGEGLVTPNYLPARVDGYTGWIQVPMVRTSVPGGLAGMGVPTEQVTVGTVAGAMADAPGVAVYPLDRGVDPTEPYLRKAEPLAYLEAGDRVTASTGMWEVPGGIGWAGALLTEAQIAELPESTQYLGRSGRLVELDDGTVGWSYAYLDLEVAALSETAAPTTEPEPTDDAVPTIGAPVEDETTETAPAAQVDPMTVPIGEETVTRRGSRIGTPSTFPIATGPSPEHPVIGKLTEGTNYPASKPFAGTETLQGDEWRAIEVLDEDGEPTRAFVRDADVLLVPGVTDADPPPLDPTWTDLVVGKADELTDAGVEKWQNRERGKFNPLKTITNAVSLMIAVPLALVAAGLLCLGGYRASVVASGKRNRRGLTGPGMLLALAPTAVGSTLAVGAAWVAPGTTTGWVITGGLAALGGAVTMMRMASRRGALVPDLTDTSWDRVALLVVGPALVLGAVSWWALGVMPAVVTATLAAGAGLGMAGRRAETDDDESDGEDEQTSVPVPEGGADQPTEPDQTSVPEEQQPEPDPFAADPDELEGQVSHPASDPFDLSDTSFEPVQPADSQPGRPAD